MGKPDAAMLLRLIMENGVSASLCGMKGLAEYFQKARLSILRLTAADFYKLSNGIKIS